MMLEIKSVSLFTLLLFFAHLDARIIKLCMPLKGNTSKEKPLFQGKHFRIRHSPH